MGYNVFNDRLARNLNTFNDGIKQFAMNKQISTDRLSHIFATTLTQDKREYYKIMELQTKLSELNEKYLNLQIDNKNYKNMYTKKCIENNKNELKIKANNSILSRKQTELKIRYVIYFKM